MNNYNPNDVECPDFLVENRNEPCKIVQIIELIAAIKSMQI
jgi:Tat protein secretion system quality control protein TatD with DNase activity